MVRIDMDMPESCYKCRFNTSECAAMGRRSYHPLRDEDDEQYDDAKYIVHRMSWCPLKEIVTCAKCRWYDAEQCPDDGFGICMCPETALYGHGTRDGFYCGNAEKGRCDGYGQD